MRFIPAPVDVPPAFIGPTSPCAMDVYSLGASTPASAAWPTANKAFFYPFHVACPTPVQRLWVANGATAAGAWSVGVYLPDGTQLLTSGAVTQAGTSVLQFATVSPVVWLPPGPYYMGMSASLATLTVIRHTLTAIDTARIAGLLEQLSAHPLPAPATFATLTTNTVPYFGLSTVSSP